jgi:hypothetical protein
MSNKHFLGVFSATYIFNHDNSRFLGMYLFIFISHPFHYFLEIATLVVIGTDCTDSCKSNKHMITTTAAPEEPEYPEKNTVLPQVTARTNFIT